MKGLQCTFSSLEVNFLVLSCVKLESTIGFSSLNSHLETVE